MSFISQQITQHLSPATGLYVFSRCIFSTCSPLSPNSLVIEGNKNSLTNSKNGFFSIGNSFFCFIFTSGIFVILSFVTRIIHDPYYLRLFFCLFSIVLPILLLKIMILNNENKNNNNLIIICSCIFFLPAFRYTSIWANDLITSLIFFLLSIVYFKKWEKNKKSNIDKNIIFQILLLACATYTRQYFAVFFIFFLYKYYLFLRKKSFLNLFLICVLTSLPVFFYTKYFLKFVQNNAFVVEIFETDNFENRIYLASSITLIICYILVQNWFYREIFFIGLIPWIFSNDYKKNSFIDILFYSILIKL